MTVVSNARSVETLVIGAGISGLAHAQALGPDADVLVVDAAAQVGGLIRTQTVPGEAGARFECGAEALQLQAALAAELGVASGVRLLPAAGHLRRRFLVRGNKLMPLPAGPLTLCATPLLSFSGKLRALRECLRDSSLALEGSVADFVRHRFGAEVLAALVDPFVTGIYAGDSEKLSVRAAFPLLVELVEQHGSVLRGMLKRSRARTALYKPEGGMQRLPEGLARGLGERLLVSRPIDQLRHVDGRFLALSGQLEIRARRVVIATEGPRAGELLRDLAPVASRELRAVPRESLAVVIHGWRREDVEHPLDGFGFLAASRENLLTLGTLFASTIDPDCTPPGTVLLRSLLGGARRPESLDRSDAEIVASIVEDNRPLLGLRGAPLWSCVERYRNTIPSYDLSHPRRVAAIERDLARIDGLELLGNSLRGIGVGSLIERARALAARG